MSGLDGLVDKPRSGRTPVLDKHDHQRLQALVAEHPQQIRVLQARFQEETGKSVATVTLRRALKKNDYNSKRIRRSLKARRNEKDFRNTQGLLKALQAREDQAISSSLTLMNQAFRKHRRCRMRGAQSANPGR